MARNNRNFRPLVFLKDAINKIFCFVGYCVVIKELYNNTLIDNIIYYFNYILYLFNLIITGT